MRVSPKQVLLNVIAATPAARIVRQLGQRLRDGDPRAAHEAQVTEVIDRLRVRRETIGDDRIRGSSLLEIGSGRDMGLALLLLHLGAKRVVNVEIDAEGFVRDRAFYQLLVDRARAAGIDVPWPPPGLVEQGRDRVAADPARIVLHLGRSAAEIPEPGGSIDVSFSVSVLQHVRRSALSAVARELYRLTRPGGLGMHRVDLSDLEGARQEPLGHLRFSEAEYQLMYGRRRSYTNRYRADDIEAIFRAAGFPEVERRGERLLEEGGYLDRALPTFQREFQEKSLAVLRVRGFMLVLRR